jgi:NAD(P)-dependent dehydrogenase (short-subunit alcohol dehydrogenase family)
MSNSRRVVVVTGASQGIGAGLVAGYRRLGFSVVATARSISPAKDEQVLAIAGDIRDRATAHKVVAAAKERFGRVDTLVNNAGIRGWPQIRHRHGQRLEEIRDDRRVGVPGVERRRSGQADRHRPDEDVFQLPRAPERQ